MDPERETDRSPSAPARPDDSFRQASREPEVVEREPMEAFGPLAFLVDPPEEAPRGREGERARNARRDWRRWLAGGSPREILGRILPGDPLGVRVLVARRLREEALLLDADRVHLRSLALCARYAARYEGRPAIESWLGRQIDEAIEELGREHLLQAAPGRASAIEDLAKPLGLEPVAMYRACLAFNRRELSERQAFFALVIEQRSLDDIAHAAGVSAGEAARRARRGLDALLGESAVFDRSAASLGREGVEP
jgi:hypothetical protein